MPGQGLQHVAALVDQHGRPVQARPIRRPAAANPSSVTSNGLFGIFDRGIDAQRHHDRLGREAADAPAAGRRAWSSQRSVAGARRDADVAVGAAAVDLVRVADGVGEPARARVDVERARRAPDGSSQKQAWVPLPWWASMSTTATRARAAPPEPGGGDGGIVEIATSAEEARTGVVTRGPADGVGGRRTSQDEVGGGGRRIAGRLGAVPGALADRRHGVHGVPAQLCPDRRRRAVRIAAVTAGDRREPVRDRVRRAGVLEVAVGHPSLVRGLQDGEEPGVVDGQQRVQTVVDRLVDRGPGLAAGLEQDMTSLGQFVGVDADAAPHARRHAVSVGARRPHHRHGQRPPQPTVPDRSRRPSPVSANAASAVGVDTSARPGASVRPAWPAHRGGA